MLFNEPKLLKSYSIPHDRLSVKVSVLFNEPKLLKSGQATECLSTRTVSVLFNEPKLLKFIDDYQYVLIGVRFSALQRAEIAEIATRCILGCTERGFSALQRAEIAEILLNSRSCANEQMFQCSSTSRNC